MRQTSWCRWAPALVICAAAVVMCAQAAQPVSFNAPREFPGGYAGIVTADFNGDGYLDIATINNYSAYAMYILLGNGDGTFRTGATYTFPDTNHRPGFIAVGDFNGDGKVDIALSAVVGVIIYLGNGDGTFQKSGTYFAGGGAGAVAVGDFNRDGIPDLAVTNSGFGTVCSSRKSRSD